MNSTGTAWLTLGTGAYEALPMPRSWRHGLVRRGKPPRDDVVRRRAFFRLLIVLVSVAMIGSGLMRLVTPHPQALSTPK
jgi:hypothetical protein